MRKSQDDLKEWQHIVTKLLRFFSELCISRGLNYYCIGGTAIGAIRHGSIIPWDDDVDVGMPRTDFDKLMEIARTEDLGEYEMLIPFETEYYDGPFAKLATKNSTLWEQTYHKCVKGINIDIFPFDPISSDKNEQQRSIKEFGRLRTDYSICNNYYNAGSFIKWLFSFHLRWLLKVVFLQSFRESAKKRIEARIKALQNRIKYDDAEYLINYSGVYGEKEIFRKELINSSILFDFSGFKVKLPVGFDEYLKKIYGDYMQLPPENKRFGHDIPFYNLHKRLTLKEIKKETVIDG